jgi:hypothetical protein
MFQERLRHFLTPKYYSVSFPYGGEVVFIDRKITDLSSLVFIRDFCDIGCATL